MYVRRGASTCDYEFMFRQHEAWLTNDPFHTLPPPWIHCRVCQCAHVCSWQCSNYCLREEPGPKRPTDVGGSQHWKNWIGHACLNVHVYNSRTAAKSVEGDESWKHYLHLLFSQMICKCALH